METAPLKSFATWARSSLIREVTARITAVLAPGSTERIEQPGTVAALEKAVQAAGGGDKGRASVAETVSYTWFNRIIALRFMDANGYTGVGVVSPQVGVDLGQPEILAEAKRGVIDTEVASQKTRTIVAGLLDGSRASSDPQGEAYALLLADYCRHWNKAMPFMFEREGDFTELLIPANLLSDDSVLNRAVSVLTEDVCEDVEVIGWLYQFYISEKKDEVFVRFKQGKKAGADELPAATQLFTPHWIVGYLVQNSLGRLWMLNRPHSRLIDQMRYYFAPVDHESDFLKIASPEELTLIDPACGSGHMLTYAFDLLYAIYAEEGYAPSEIPHLILKHNLYGAEIDPRAGALAAFALTMKAREKERTFFTRRLEPNMRTIVPVAFTAEELDFLGSIGEDAAQNKEFWNLFKEADVLGSLSQPEASTTLRLARHVKSLDDEGDLWKAEVLERAKVALLQMEFLAPRYSVVIANPPYLGRRNMTPPLSDFARTQYPRSRADLYAMFIERALALRVHRGWAALVTQQSWMFLSTYRELRERILETSTIANLAHLGPGAFDSISGEVVSTAAFVIEDRREGSGNFVRLTKPRGENAKEAALLSGVRDARAAYRAASSELLAVPGAPIAYWLSPEARDSFRLPTVAAQGQPRVGMQTADNGRFVRFWWEISNSLIGDPGDVKPSWVRYLKGGSSRRWAGTVEYVVHYGGDGSQIRATPNGSTISLERANAAKLEWTDISTSGFAVRAADPLTMHDINSHCFYPQGSARSWLLAYANSAVFRAYLAFLSPGLSNQVGDVGRVPLLSFDQSLLSELANDAEQTARADWTTNEICRDFPGLITPEPGLNLEDAVERIVAESDHRIHHLEAIDAAIDKETRRVAPPGLELDEEYGDEISELYDRTSRRDVVADFVSYAVGCVFGRYSLDEPGLILADRGATVRDYLAKVRSPTFMPDADNVVPIVDGDWFEDDIFERFRKFLHSAFGANHFEDNLRFVTESLGVKDLRDYFVKSFYKDHVQRYKKRPIYWLFSSPNGSFNALIYMHRYTPSTVSTVLNEYLREFQAKLKASLEHAERSNNGKEADRLRKILLELDGYEHDVLYPLASKNIAIDLDDGVKVNYPKFGAALKKIPGLEASQ